MLGKLMKYEWRGLRFPILLMMGILGGITALTCGLIFTINPRLDSVASGFSTLSIVVCVLLYYFGVIGCALGTMLMIAIRFYKTTYTDQGYLTHTLPVETKTLLTAKSVTSALCYLLLMLWIAVTVFVILCAAYVHISNLYYDGSLSELNKVIAGEVSGLAEDFRMEYGMSFGAFAAFYVIFFIVGGISAIMTIFGCVSLGQLYAKHRVIGAIIAYFAVFAVQQFISYLSMLPTYSKLLRAESLSENMPIFSVIRPTVIIALIWAVVLSVIMYFVSLHMMTKRLNLE